MKIPNFRTRGAQAKAESLQEQIARLLQEVQRGVVEVGVRSTSLCDGSRRSIYSGSTGDLLHPTVYDPQAHDARQIMHGPTARTGGETVYVRVNRPETQLPVVLLIDGGRTQLFASSDETKLWLVAKAAVTLCLSLRDTQDRVLPIIFGGDKILTTGIPSSPHQIMYQIAAQLLQPSFSPTPSSIGQALDMVPDRQSEVVIISDFIGLTEELTAKLNQCGRRNSTRAVIVQDRRERELPTPHWWWPLPSLIPVFDLGSGQEAAWWSTPANRRLYKREFEEREKWLQAVFTKSGIRFETIETNQGVDAIRKFLRLLAMPPLT